MMYLNHDFYKNLVAGVKSGDVVFVTSLFVNELSDVVVFDTAKLVSVLNKTGLKVKVTDADETLVSKTLKALPQNVQLQKGLAFLFAEINGLINNNKGNQQTWKKTIDDIASATNMVALQLSQKGSYAASVKEDVMQQIAGKAASKGDYNRQITAKKSGKGKKALFIIGGVAVLTTIVLLIRKYWVSDAQATVPAIAAPTPMPAPVNPHVLPPQPVPQPVMQQPVGQPNPVPVTQPIQPPR